MLLLLVATLLLLLRNRLLGAEARFVSVARQARPHARCCGCAAGAGRSPACSASTSLFSTLIPVLGLALMSVVVVLTPLVAPWHLLTWDHWRTL